MGYFWRFRKIVVLDIACLPYSAAMEIMNERKVGFDVVERMPWSFRCARFQIHHAISDTGMYPVKIPTKKKKYFFAL